MATKILKEVIERVQNWPEERQADAAQVLLEMERQDASRYRLTDAQARAFSATSERAEASVQPMKKWPRSGNRAVYEAAVFRGGAAPYRRYIQLHQ